MVAFDWNELIKEMSSRCPLLFGHILSSSPKEQDNIGQCFATYGAVLCHLNAAKKPWIKSCPANQHNSADGGQSKVTGEVSCVTTYFNWKPLLCDLCSIVWF